jgi:hypothetical protein
MCEYLYIMSEQEERAALAGLDADAADAETDDPATWSASTRVTLAGEPYEPTTQDLAAQAAADDDQQRADRDYRQLTQLVIAGARCACDEPSCLLCRCARWLAGGL